MNKGNNISVTNISAVIDIIVYSILVPDALSATLPKIVRHGMDISICITTNTITDILLPHSFISHSVYT